MRRFFSSNKEKYPDCPTKEDVIAKFKFEIDLDELVYDLISITKLSLK